METIAKGTNGTTTAEYFDPSCPMTEHNKIPPTVEGEREEDPFNIDELEIYRPGSFRRTMFELWKYFREQNKEEPHWKITFLRYFGFNEEYELAPLSKYLRHIAPMEGTEINHPCWEGKETAIRRDRLSSPLDVCNIACGRC